MAAFNPDDFPPPEEDIFAIVYDFHAPSEQSGGIASRIPINHRHANHGNGYYYRKLAARLQDLGYQMGEYSFYAKQTTRALALADAATLQTHPDLTWMPFMMQRMHVVQLCHAASLY